MDVREHVARVRFRLTAGLAVLAVAVVTGACGSEAPPPEPAAEPEPPSAPAEQAPMGGQPRVYFIEPQEGATVKSPVHFVFGIENYEIAPVPEGTVEVVREGMGHHHIGVDTDCLPPGEVIPQAAPWIHFGTGANEIDLQLEPGPHTFALQLGDDQHRTIEGLCSTISITVVE